ncbi:MAG TPA: hypothetical protein DIT25_01265 [Candidatus Moranbacteria bacterium]|nr:hypothetical protein [Candidatus Moranbacteria bacterium]
MEEMITNSSEETRDLGKKIAGDILKGSDPSIGIRSLIVCLSGDLGAGKTTFTQGLLEGLGAEGPYTSPTFLIIKQYRVSQIANRKSHIENSIHDPRSTIKDIYHIDTYRVGADDILDLGWEEIVADPQNVVIIEWPERIKEIIPESAIWINFEWMDQSKRKITFLKLETMSKRYKL